MNRWKHLSAAIVCAVCLFLAFNSNTYVFADTNVGGTINENITWNTAGSPYRVTGDIYVAEGATLTIEAGVVVRFEQTRGIWVDGTLQAVGTSDAPITFTGTTEQKNWWRYINIRNAGSATLAWCRIAHGGWYENAGVLKTGTGALSITNTVLDNNNGDGLRIAAGYSSFTSAGNTFSNSNYGVRLGINASFDDNTSSFQGNTIDLYADGGTINQEVIWNLRSDYSVYMAWDITIAALGKLTVKPGTVVKIAQNQGISVYGQLDARGSSGAPIYFTDWRDDTVGGDANKDGGSSAPAPGWWRYIYIRDGGSAALAWCRIAYGGWYDGVGILKTGSGSLNMTNGMVSQTVGNGLQVVNSTGSVVLDDSTFSNNTGSGLYMNAGPVTASGCIFRDNGGYGILQEINDSLLYTGNTFTGNGLAGVGVRGGTISKDITWNVAGSPYRVTGDLTVALGATLTIDPGVVVRFEQTRGIWVDGTLQTVGTSDAPITFTGTTEQKNWWRYINIRNAGSATLAWCRIAHGGWYENAGVLKTGTGALSITNTVLDNNNGDGLRIAAGYSSFTSAGNTFSNSNYGVRLGINASFDDNTSSFQGNNVDLYADGGTIDQEVIWNLRSDYSVYMAWNTTIAASGKLTVKPGTVVKIAQNQGIWVDGQLDARGSSEAPIYFTDWRDDTVGGDANKDGTDSAPGPGWWRYITIRNAGSATLAWCRIAYGGWNDGVGILKTGSGSLSMTNCTVSQTVGNGLHVAGSTGSVVLADSTFSSNTGSGLYMNAGPVTAAGCVFSNNAGYGILQEINDSLMYTGNTITGNGQGGVGVRGGTISTNITWRSAGSPYRVTGDIYVAAGATLTIEAGVVVRFEQTRGLWVDGTLQAAGTSEALITFTGTTEQKNWWRYLNIRNAGSATLDWCRIAYGGWYENAGVLKTGTGALSITNTVLDNNNGDGLRIAAGYSSFTSAGNTFSNSNYGVRLGINAFFDDNTSSFQGNTIDLYADGGTINQAVIWNLKGDYSVYMAWDITIAASGKLTVKPGTVVKVAQNQGIWVDGQLDARGTSGAPIYFTDWRDDTVGGDANKDGASSAPGPGWWRYLNIRNAGSATLAWCRIAYGGWNDRVGVLKTGSGDLSLYSTIIRNVSGDGLRLDGSSGDHDILKCRFNENSNGVLVRNQTATLAITRSAVEGNAGHGLINQGSFDVDARSCWWGHVSGPYHPASNPEGQGNPVSNGVLFEPWRLTEADNEILTPIRSGTLVKGDSLRFVGAGEAGPAAQYRWHFGGGRTSSLLSPGLVTFPEAGDFTVTYEQVVTGQTDPYPDFRTYSVVDNNTTFPDLEVAAVTVPASLGVGQTATIAYRVKNTGTKALQGAGWIDALYLSTDKYLDIKDTLLARVSVTQDLGIGNVYDGTISFTFPAVEEGAYYLILSINDDWQVIELRRMNNEHAAAANGLVPALISGESQNVAFSDRSLTHYYRIDIAASENLMIPFSSKAAGFEVYVRFGALPSRGTYDYRMDMGTGHLLIPAASVGTWYVLVYGEGLSQADQYSIMYSTADLSLGSVSPGRQGTGLKIDLALTGAGFAAPMQAALEKTGGGGTYHASSVEVDSYTGAVATFAAGSVPAGVYDVKVSRSGGVSAVLPAAVEIVDGGKPRFETRLILPERFGYHQLATVFVEYANRGDAPMPAPLLLLRPTQTGKPGAILTLDKTRLSSGFWTSAMPEGFSNEVQFLASGETPGLLLPGESRRVPIYYAGWQQPWSFSYPPFEWGLGVLSADNATPVDWASMRDAMRPPQMTAEAWTVLWSNFTAQIGPTWGDYVRMLSANAVYLHRLGQRVEAIDKLLGFSLVRADSLNPVHVLSAATDAAVSAPGLSITFERMFAQPISRRYEVGPLGRGWTHAWQFSTAKKADGTIVLTDMTGARRIFQPDSRYSGRYVAQPGDQGSLSDAGGGLMLKEIDGMILTFHGDGRLQYLEDAGGNRITCEYTGTLLTRLNHSSGQWLALTYNASGRIASVMDKDGRGTLYTYGASGAHLLTATSDDGVVTTYAYSSGQGTAREHALTQITLSDGLKQYLTYDGQGRLASLYRDGDAEKITFTYDGHGTVGVQDALGKINRFFFDDMGRLARAENGSGSAVSLEYNDWGLLKKVVDPAGVSRINEFDGKGNLAVLTDAQRNRTRFSYSRAFNRLSRVTDAKGHVSAYDYDARGHLAAITYPDGSRETWTNDGLGNPTIWTNRRGGSIGYTFDGSGRVMRKSYADGPTIDYTYDNRGNLTRTVDGSGTTDFIYDAKDRLTQVDYPGGRRLGFTYDTLGRRATSLDHLGNQIHYHYDAIGRLERLTGNGGADRVRYTYDQAGRLSRKTLGNGVYTDYDYDGAGRLLRLLNQKGDGSVLSSFQYTYDSRGRRTAMDTHYGTWIYRYDGNGQLTKAVLASSDARIPNQDISYEYDALGNRTQALVNGTPIFYSANSLNQYSAVGDKTFAYDADGNLVMDISSGETTTYGYDQENRLVSVARGGKTWTYTYDALGNRASMAEDGVVTSYLIDPAGLGDVVGEYNAAGGLIAGYVHGIGLAGCVGSGGTVDYYTFDAMGNVSELTGADGIRRNAYAYTPFGATILAEKSVANPFAYAGQVGIMADPNGLNHMRARHYAADAGRFIQPDPLGLLGGPNLYSYADNNPVSFLDPQGMAPVPVEALVTWIIKNGSEVAFLNRALRFASIQKIAPHLLSMVHKNQVPQMVSLIIRNLNRGELAGCLKGLVTSSAPAAGTGTAAAGGTAAASSILFTPVSQVGAVPLVAAGAAAFAGGYAIGWAADTYFPNNPASQGAYWLGSAFFNWYYGVSSTASSGTAGSQDPNQKLVAGTGSANAMAYVAGEALLSYRIDFENDAQATAPAQVVLIKDKLSDKLDWSSFELAEVGFGAELIAIPAGLKYFETAVPYRYKDDQYDMEIEVRIEAGLNIERGELFANFYSYDPETGLPPPVNIGFLPPENETGRGQGHVSFIIKPRAGLVSGTEVRNVAAIQFDFGTTIATNQVDPHDPGKGTDPAKEAPATIDLVAPSSSVTAVVPVNDNDLLVSWSGTDVGSGIASYTIYVQENDGPFTPWLTSAATSAVFTGVAGNTYHFYSVATDHVGNKESTTEELYALIVTRIGAGSGVIASSPAGIDCGTDCSETYPPNAVVTLAATADAGSSFRGWAGACTGTGPCRIVMDSPKRKNVTAQFRSLSSRGDLNNDARVDLTDLIVGLKALGRVPSGGLRADLWQADVNANDVVDMGEILYILQAVSEARP